MPNRDEHIKTGFWLGFSCAFLDDLSRQNLEIQNGLRIDYNWSKMILEGIISGGSIAIGECVPDSFEPAIHPNHRGFFHSFASFGLIAAILFQDELSNDRILNIFSKGLSAGYLLHLFQDSQTPNSIHLL
jgi:membrane-bound metal-dependent hydrolase YbcI (DUF457 family)